jgi:formylglycine-generating enzyme required for sulfatase activity
MKKVDMTTNRISGISNMKGYLFFAVLVLESLIQTANPTSAQPQATQSPSDMVRIAGGTFTMGIPSSAPLKYSFEHNPQQHQVTVSSFYIGKKKRRVTGFYAIRACITGTESIFYW